MIEPHIYQLIVEQTKDYAVFFLDLEGRVMSWNAGFDLHLVKPVDTTELLQALNGRNGATLH